MGSTHREGWLESKEVTKRDIENRCEGRAEGNDSFVYKCEDAELCNLFGITPPACIRVFKDPVELLNDHMIPYYAAQKYIYQTLNNRLKIQTEFGIKIVRFLPFTRMFLTSDQEYYVVCSPWIEGQNFAIRYKDEGKKYVELQKQLDILETVIAARLDTVGISGASLFPVNFTTDDVNSPFITCTDVGGYVRSFQFT